MVSDEQDCAIAVRLLTGETFVNMELNDEQTHILKIFFNQAE